ncbi:MAG: DUF4421 family protein [Bacteroidales bacterium]|nr:DUF4421 family protein [Bacteroidales bacterium]
MFRYFLLFLFFFVSLVSAKAQFDTNYVHLTKNQFTLYPMAESAYLELQFEDPEFKKGVYQSKLTSRVSTSVGFGMSFYRIGFSFSFQIPYSNIDELKNSEAFSFAGGYSYHRFYGELRYRDFKGFQKSDLMHDSLGEVQIRKDIELRQVGVALNYFFSKKYNFDANFKNYNIQKKSAVSLFIMGGANRYDISGKYLIIDTLNYASEIDMVRDLDVWSFKAAPGVAFSLTHKGFYTSGLFGIGVSYNKNNLFGDENKETVNTWAPIVETKMVVGYNNQKWFTSLSLNIERDYFFFDRVNLSVANVFFNFKVGYRFNAKYLGKLGKYL